MVTTMIGFVNCLELIAHIISYKKWIQREESANITHLPYSLHYKQVHLLHSFLLLTPFEQGDIVDVLFEKRVLLGCSDQGLLHNDALESGFGSAHCQLPNARGEGGGFTTGILETT